MTKSMTVVGVALTGLVVLCGPAFAQGAKQTVEAPSVPAVEAVEAVAAHQATTGYRASKVIGSAVLNSAGDTIGEIDDIIVSSDGEDPYAAISVGGFLGMGERLILVRYDSLALVDNKVVLAGGTKEGLEAMPEFTYAKG